MSFRHLKNVLSRQDNSKTKVRCLEDVLCRLGFLQVLRMRHWTGMNFWILKMNFTFASKTGSIHAHGFKNQLHEICLKDYYSLRYQKLFTNQSESSQFGDHYQTFPVLGLQGMNVSKMAVLDTELTVLICRFFFFRKLLTHE